MKNPIIRGQDMKNDVLKREGFLLTTIQSNQSHYMA